MRSEILTRPSRPWVHRMVALAPELSDTVVSLEAADRGRRVAARVLRGRKATTRAAFLDEAAAALQFPLYFGGNWDAFYDCLTDLSWLRAEAVVLVIADAGHLLEHASARDIDAMTEVLREAMLVVNDQERGVGPRSLHLVLHTTPEERGRYQQRWAGSDLEADAADLP